MNWSHYQQGIFEAVAGTNDSLLVEAVAGSGKSTTLVEIVNRIPMGKKAILLAFNKRIADTLKEKVDQRRAQCRTLHSVGNAAWLQALDWDAHLCKLEPSKNFKVMNEVMSYGQRQKYSQMSKLIGIAKGIGMVPAEAGIPGLKGLVEDEVAVWERLVGFYDLDQFVEEFEELRAKRIKHAGHDFPDDETEPDGIILAKSVLIRSIECARTLYDFDDQLYMPVISGSAFDKFDVVMLDEAQDVNQMQAEIVARLLAPGGRVIAVGDPHQAIYGFRGAMSNSMQQIATRFGCRPLPLSVSYRCPKLVVQAAREYVGHIEPFEGAEDGLVEGCPQYDVRGFQPEDVILCRLNAPLVSLAFSLIRNKVACKVLGKDIASGLTGLVKRMKAGTVEELIEALSLFLKREAIRHADDPAALSRAGDKVDTLHVFIDELGMKDTVAQLIMNIERMFVDPIAGVAQAMLTLSTVHKAKGGEWDRVFILDREELMPLPWAKSGWQQDQEFNLLYVAITRAKKELRFVSSEGLGIMAPATQVVIEDTPPVEDTSGL